MIHQVERGASNSSYCIETDLHLRFSKVSSSPGNNLRFSGIRDPAGRFPRVRSNLRL